MFWLQLPSLTLSVYPHLPTSLSQLAALRWCSLRSTSSPAPHEGDGCCHAAEVHSVVRKWVGGTRYPRFPPGCLGVICRHH